MRTLEQLFGACAVSHRHPTNQLIHYACVPLIAASSLALLWPIALGRWFGLDATVAPWVNVVTLAFVPLSIFYMRLSWRSLITMVVWYLFSICIIVLLQQTLGTRVLVTTAALFWIGARASQFYGHVLEDARPSFAQDLVFLLIGPLFVTEKLFRRVGPGGL